MFFTEETKMNLARELFQSEIDGVNTLIEDLKECGYFTRPADADPDEFETTVEENIEERRVKLLEDISSRPPVGI